VKEIPKVLFRRAAEPVGRLLAGAGIPADAVSAAGLLLAAAAAYGFLSGRTIFTFCTLLGSGLCDLLDGAVARSGGRRGTPFGAVLDSTFDRYGEGLVLGAILVRMAAAAAPVWALAVAVLAILGSFLVSYVRARSEALGISCEVGLLERPERWLFLLVIALLRGAAMLWVLGALALLAHVTVIQRVIHVRRQAARLPALRVRSEKKAE
jgi:CDP-diacylglycerol--glycerol-3-phosphate 3-phosphatidyltransferase